MLNLAFILMLWTRVRHGLKAVVLRHEQTPNTGRANRRSEQPFHFTDLPFDIRLMIYDICLTAPSNITIRSSALHRGPNKRPDRTAVDPGGGRKFQLIGHTKSYWLRCNYFNALLLFTCKLVYEEAITIVYSRNCFDFSQGHMSNPCNALAEFTNRLHPATLTQLRKLTLGFLHCSDRVCAL